MGQNNRQRRAAKQRQRTHHQRSNRDGRAGPSADGVDDVDDEVFAVSAASLLLGRALHRLARNMEAQSDLLDFQHYAARHQQAAVDEHFALAVHHLLAAGWTPLDLHEVMMRKTGSAARAHLLDVVAEATARHPGRLVHPQWLAQLEQVGAEVRGTERTSPAYSWGGRAGLDWPEALEQLLAVLVVINSLPPVERVLPAPGDTTADGQGRTGVDDGKVLRRVRALLAKAESTEYAEEADALTAKAQQLMSRHSIDRAMAEPAERTPEPPICRRLWLEAPYVDAKALLVEVVANANNCRAIQSQKWGFVTVIGHRVDLDVVELLVTSLLLQATRAVALAGPQSARRRTSRTRSFRQSFLVAYANRIGERLASSALDAEAEYNGAKGGALVPVLAARRERVDAKLHELFPELIERRVSVSNAAGWGAGRAAADLAHFGVHEIGTPRAG